MVLQVAPIPSRVTAAGEFSAVLVIVRLPLAPPDAVGVKVTSSVILSPIFSVFGKVSPVDANGTETVMALTVMDPELLFETTTV